MNVVACDLLTNYHLNGKGKLVVLLHGWGDSIKGLSGLQDELSKHYLTLSVDLPGFGGSEAPKEAWDLDDYSEFLQKLLVKLDLGEPYCLIGHSNGGGLAIRAISLGLIKPKKLVLLAAAGIRTDNRLRRSALSITAKTGKAATIWLPKTKRQALRKKLYAASGSDMLVSPHLSETFKRTVRQDVQADAKNLSLPTLLIYGDLDKATPLAYGERYHSLIKDSRLEVINGVGHFIHQDEPSKVYNIIEEFLS